MATPTTNRHLLFFERPSFWVLLVLVLGSLGVWRGVSASEAEGDVDRWASAAVHQEAARRMVAGAPIYQKGRSDSTNVASHAPSLDAHGQVGSTDSATGFEYSHPPLIAMLAASAGWFGRDAVGQAIWLGWMLGCVAVGLLLAFRLVLPLQDPRFQAGEQSAWLGHYAIGPLAGRPASSQGALGLLSRATHTRAGLLLVGVMVLVVPMLVWSPRAVGVGQTVGFLAAIAGGLAVARGRGVVAGICLGLAAASEPILIVALLWLLWKREWRAGAIMLGVGAALSVLPEFGYPASGGRWWLVQWWDGSNGPLAAAQGRGLVGAIQRVFTDAPSMGGELGGLGWLSTGAAQGVGYAVLATLAGFALWATRPMPRSGRESSEAWAGVRRRRWTQRWDEQDSIGVARELSLVFALAVLVGGVSGLSQLCLLLVGFLVLLREAVVTRDRVLIALVVAVGAALLALRGPMLGLGAREWLGRFGAENWAVLVVYFGLLRSCGLARRG